ncbi:hypothetical protein AB833_23500 [Chromatiales bacterium (ex Bugula neritina AB1)]|nr:hypothetical protein AB833_23500 [Chromatiales bacterium (ex Bugula neritina AB1)]
MCSAKSYVVVVKAVLLAVAIVVAPNLSADNAKALIKEGRNKAQGCTRCHGRYGLQAAAQQQGSGTLVGAFVKRELENFRTGSRQHAIMSAVAARLSDTDIKAISAWFDSIQK